MVITKSQIEASMCFIKKSKLKTYQSRRSSKKKFTVCWPQFFSVIGWSFTNYRPIANLCCTSKIFKKTNSKKNSWNWRCKWGYLMALRSVENIVIVYNCILIKFESHKCHSIVQSKGRRDYRMPSKVTISRPSWRDSNVLNGH